MWYISACSAATSHTVRENKISRTFDVIRPPSADDPRGYYLSCHNRTEAEMICALLNGDSKRAMELRELLLIKQQVLKEKST